MSEEKERQESPGGTLCRGIRKGTIRMNRLRHRYHIYPLLCGLPALAAVALRTVACLTDLNFNTGYFTGGKWHLASCWLLFAAVMIALTYPLTHREHALRADFSSPLGYVPTGVCGVALIFCALSLLVTLLRQMPLFPLLKLVRGMYGMTASGFLASAERAVGLLTVLLAPGAVFHLFYTAFLPQGRSTRRANCGILCVLFFAMYTAYLYFNTTLPLNSPVKTVNLLACLSCALFLLYETRVSLGRERWRLYITFGMIAAAMTAYAAVPALVTYFVRGHLLATSVAEIMLTLSVLLFALTRLFLTGRWAQSETAPFIDALREAAERRAMAVGGFDPQRQAVSGATDAPATKDTKSPDDPRNAEDSHQIRWEFPMPGESFSADGADLTAAETPATGAALAESPEKAQTPVSPGAPEAGTVEETPGEQTSPQGTTEEPSGEQTSPQETADELSGERTLPQGTAEEPSGEQTSPQKTADELSGEQTFPQETAEEPSGEQTFPQETGTGQKTAPEQTGTARETAPEQADGQKAERADGIPAQEQTLTAEAQEAPAAAPTAPEARAQKNATVTNGTQRTRKTAGTGASEIKTESGTGTDGESAENDPATVTAGPKRQRTVRVSVKEPEAQTPEENPNSGFRRISVKKKSPPRVPADVAPGKGDGQKKD